MVVHAAAPQRAQILLREDAPFLFSRIVRAAQQQEQRAHAAAEVAVPVPHARHARESKLGKGSLVFHKTRSVL